MKKFYGHPPKETLAYIAGLIDGEGCLTMYKEKDLKGVRETRRGFAYHPLLRVTNTNFELLNWLKKIMGGFICVSRERKGNRQDIGHWSLNSNGLRELLPKFIPYLRIKRQQAELLIKALNFLSKSKPYHTNFEKELADIFNTLKKLNKRGKR